VDIEHLSMCVLPTIERIPNEFIESWGRFRCEVARRLLNTSPHWDDVGSMMRALKWFLGDYQILFHKPRKKRRRRRRGSKSRRRPRSSLKQSLSRRFTALSEGRYADLIDEWQSARDHYLRRQQDLADLQHRPGQHSPSAEERELKATRKGAALILQQECKRGLRTVEGKGIHSAWDVQDQMVEKHGAAQSPRWDPRLTQDLPSAEVEDLEEWARKADPKSGAGLDGRRAHSVMCLAQYAFADHAEDDDEDESDPLHGPSEGSTARPSLPRGFSGRRSSTRGFRLGSSITSCGADSSRSSRSTPRSPRRGEWRRGP